MLIGSPTSSRRSPTLAMKMSLSHVAALGSVLIGHPGIPGYGGGADTGHARPDLDRWYAMNFPSGDQLTEPPRVSSFWGLPSSFIKNRSPMLVGTWPSRALFRLLSNRIHFPSGERTGN